LYRSFHLTLSLALACLATLPANAEQRAAAMRSEVVAEPGHPTIYNMPKQTGPVDKTSGRYLQSVGKRVASKPLACPPPRARR